MSTRISIDVQTGALLRAAQANQSAVRRGFVEGQTRELAAAEAQAAKEADLEAKGLQVVGSVGADGSIRIGQRAKPVPRVQPRMTANRFGEQAFIFVPQQVDGVWQLKDGAPLFGQNTSDPEGVLDYVIATYSATGGPKGGPAINYDNDNHAGFLQTFSKERYVTTKGITLDAWVRFPGAGTPVPDPATEYASYVGFFLTKSPLDWGRPDGVGGYPFSSDVAPALELLVTYYATLPQLGGQNNKLIALAYSTWGRPVGSANASRVAQKTVNVLVQQDGATVDQLGGWNHYALEVSVEGLYVMYFNGVPVFSENSTPPVFADLSNFVAGWPFFQTDTSYNIETSLVRYRKKLAYGGNAFTP